MSMRRILALCLFIAAMPVALASVRVAFIHESVQRPWITVLLDGSPVSGAKIELVTQQPPYGYYKKLRFRLVTDAKGQVELPKLPNGTYTLVASSGPELTAALYLRFSSRKATLTSTGGPLLSNETGKERYFVMELHHNLTPTLPITRQQLLANAAHLPLTQIATFQGTVSDFTGAHISHASIAVTRIDKDGNRQTRHLKTDEQGRFSGRLARGEYIAEFLAPGFRTHVLHLKIAKAASAHLLQIKLQPGEASQ